MKDSLRKRCVDCDFVIYNAHIRKKEKEGEILNTKMLCIGIATAVCVCGLCGFVDIKQYTLKTYTYVKEPIEICINNKDDLYQSDALCAVVRIMDSIHPPPSKYKEIHIEYDIKTNDDMYQGILKDTSGDILLGNYKLTAYCSCEKCCGKYALNRPVDENGKEIVYGASGCALRPNHSIAVDTNIIPYGTRVLINGQEYVAEDRGGNIKGNRIDIYFDSHEEARSFGVQYAEVYLLEE